jgi:hypothetical protein
LEKAIMARPVSAFRQQDVTRATRAVAAAGQHITGVQIEKDGKLTILTGAPNPDGFPDEIALSGSIHV